MMETKVVHIWHHITSLAYGSPFNFNFFWWAEIFLVHLCLHFFPFLIQCPLWNTLSGNICSELQSNYTITKSFIMRLLKLNVEKKFDFPLSNHINFIPVCSPTDWRNMAGQSQRLFRISKSGIDQFLRKKRKLRAAFSLRVQD